MYNNTSPLTPEAEQRHKQPQSPSTTPPPPPLALPRSAVLSAILNDDNKVINHLETRSLLPRVNLDAFSQSTPDQQQYVQAFHALNLILPPEHPTTIKLQEILNEIMGHADIPPNTFKICVYKYIFPQAEIDPFGHEVRISDSLLEIMDHDEDMVTAILGHEIGHILISNDDELTEETIETKLENKVMSYEHEYQADRLSAIFMSRMKRNPQSLEEALTRLNNFYKPFQDKVIDESNDQQKVEKNYNSWVLSSHPYLRRRINSMKALSRRLPYRKNRQTTSLPNASKRDFRNAQQDIVANGENYTFSTRGYNESTRSVMMQMDDYTDLEHLKKEGCKDVSSMIDCEIDGEIDFLEIEPAEVNRLTEKDVAQIHQWWNIAFNNLLDVEGLEDLQHDISQYSLNTVRTLLLGMPLIQNMKVERFDTIDDYHDWNKRYRGEFLPTSPLTAFYAEIELRENLFAMSAILMKRFMAEFDEKPQVQDIEKILTFLRDFRVKTGLFMPYDQVRVRDYILKAFRAYDDDKKIELCKLLDEYMTELHSGLIGNVDLILDFIEINEWMSSRPDLEGVGWGIERPLTIYERDKTLDNLQQWSIRQNFNHPYLEIEIFISRSTTSIKAEPMKNRLIIPASYQPEQFEEVLKALRENAFQCLNIFHPNFEHMFKDSNRIKGRVDRSEVKQYSTELEQMIDMLVTRANQQTKEDIRDLLSQIQPNYKSNSWMYAIQQKRTGQADTEEYDRLREASPMVTASILSQDEFEEEYFGKGRKKTKNLAYESAQSNISVYRQIEELWQRAEYAPDLSAIQDPREKALYIIEKYPACCAFRDQYIVDALNWHPLKAVSDLQNVINDIDACEDIPLLTRLLNNFWHPVLLFSCSNRLWELQKQLSGEEFFAQIPADYKQTAIASLAVIPRLTADEEKELTLINICYPYASYHKDELLQKHIDNAGDEEKTLAICRFLIAPPPSTIKTKSVSQLVMGESILDVFDRMDTIDKEEALLYLLGQTHFYSGIDETFDLGTSADLDTIRSNTLYEYKKMHQEIERRKENFKFNDPYNVDFESEEIDFSITRVELNYFSDVPDSIVHLTKALGMPSDLFFKQGRITTTRQEQKNLLEAILFGNRGILTGENANKFIRRTAELIVDKGNFADGMSANDKPAFIDLFAFALANCPKDKLADLFLQCWYLSAEKSLSVPELVSKLMQQYGSVFIKAGQYLATQTTNLPPEWIKAFRSLSDGNTLSDKTLVYEYEQSSYGGNSPFNSIGRKLAEGSMAAVYKGKINSGTDVAIKIIHPWIERELDEDIAFLDKIVEFINGNRDTYHVSLPSNLGEVTRKQLLEEINTAREAENNDQMRAILAKHENGVKFSLPAYHSKHSSDQFYVMDYVDGVYLDDEQGLKRYGLDGIEMRNTAALEVLRQIIQEGIYQADPNLGNFKININESGKPVIHWLDCGHLGRLTPEQRDQLKQLIFSIVFNKDVQATSQLLTQMIQNTNPLTENAIHEWLQSKNLHTINLENMETMFNEFLDFCVDQKYILHECWVTLFRTLGLLRPLLTGITFDRLAGIF